MNMLASFAMAVVMAATEHGGGRTVELLGQPVRARNILEGRIVLSRQTGKEMMVLSNNNEALGAELIFVDFENDTGFVLRAPAGAGAEALTEIPGDRLALGTFYDGKLMIFDLKTMEFIKTVNFPGEKYIWGFAMGKDGRMYGGTFPGGKLGALNLSTYALEDLGAGAPPNFYLRFVVAAADGRILCRFRAEKPTWLVFDPASKRFDEVPEELRVMRYAAMWNGYIVGENRAFEGHDFRPLARVPFPVPLVQEDDGPIADDQDAGHARRAKRVKEAEWDVDTFLTTPDALYIREGREGQRRTYWRYRKNDEGLTLVTSTDLRGARLLGETSDGRMIGIRGQDYFTIKPGDATLDLRPIPGESSPRTISFLDVDPKGRIWGGPPYGQTLFWMDPTTKSVVNTSAIADIGGEVYGVAFLEGVTYAAAYAGGDIVRYDPDKPWDQWNQKNPQTIASIGSAGFNRPTGGIIVGPGGKLYSGWTAGSGYGGAVAVTDPKSGKTELLTNPLGEQQIMGIATDGKLLYVGTGLGGSGLPTKPGEFSKIGIIDPATKKVVWEQTINGAERVRIVGYDRMTQIVPAIVDAHIRLFDASTRTFLERGQGAPTVASWSHALPGDGRMYYGSGKLVLALDLCSGAVETVADAPGYVNNVAIGPDGTLYFGIGPDLYAIHKSVK